MAWYYMFSILAKPSKIFYKLGEKYFNNSSLDFNQRKKNILYNVSLKFIETIFNQSGINLFQDYVKIQDLVFLRVF